MPDWMVDELLRRERERQDERPSLYVELPLPSSREPAPVAPSERGVFTFDM